MGDPEHSKGKLLTSWEQGRPLSHRADWAGQQGEPGDSTWDSWERPHSALSPEVGQSGASPTQASLLLLTWAPRLTPLSALPPPPECPAARHLLFLFFRSQAFAQATPRFVDKGTVLHGDQAEAEPSWHEIPVLPG